MTLSCSFVSPISDDDSEELEDSSENVRIRLTSHGVGRPCWLSVGCSQVIISQPVLNRNRMDLVNFKKWCFRNEKWN